MSDPLEAALREALKPGIAPADLREGLLAAGRVEDRARALRRTRRTLQMGLAAALVLALGAGGAWLKARTRPADTALAQAALSDFMAIRGLPPEEAAPAGPCAHGPCEESGAALPRACAGMALGHGRGCRLQGRNASCFRLRDGRSLYVFAHPIPGAGALQGRPLAVAANYQATAWNEDGRGYVLVMPRNLAEE